MKTNGQNFLRDKEEAKAYKIITNSAQFRIILKRIYFAISRYAAYNDFVFTGLLRNHVLIPVYVFGNFFHHHDHKKQQLFPKITFKTDLASLLQNGLSSNFTGVFILEVVGTGDGSVHVGGGCYW
jgi:hypothetical protein